MSSTKIKGDMTQFGGIRKMPYLKLHDKEDPFADCEAWSWAYTPSSPYRSTWLDLLSSGHRASAMHTIGYKRN